jgi:alkylphosphonate utilization operon protein PhnA
MNKPACPMCEMTEVLEFPERWECVTCGHEWPREAQPDAPDTVRVVKDAHGNVLADGDCVILIKDLKLGGGSQVLTAEFIMLTFRGTIAPPAQTCRRRLPSAINNTTANASMPILKYRSAGRLPMKPTKLNYIEPRMTPKIVVY